MYKETLTPSNPEVSNSQFILFKVNQQGQVSACGTAQDPSNGAVPGECNSWITPDGAFIPPNALFKGGDNILGRVVAVVLQGAAAAAAPFTPAGQAANNVTSAISPYDSIEMQKAMTQLQKVSKVSKGDGDNADPIDVTSDSHYDPTVTLLQKNANAYISSCQTSKKPDAGCAQALTYTQDFGIVTGASGCGLNQVSPQSGEYGSSPLWEPDQPFPTPAASGTPDCGATLLAQNRTGVLSWIAQQKQASQQCGWTPSDNSPLPPAASSTDSNGPPVSSPPQGQPPAGAPGGTPSAPQAN